MTLSAQPGEQYCPFCYEKKRKEKKRKEKKRKEKKRKEKKRKEKKRKEKKRKEKKRKRKEKKRKEKKRKEKKRKEKKRKQTKKNMSDLKLETMTSTGRVPQVVVYPPMSPKKGGEVIICSLNKTFQGSEHVFKDRVMAQSISTLS